MITHTVTTGYPQEKAAKTEFEIVIFGPDGNEDHGEYSFEYNEQKLTITSGESVRLSGTIGTMKIKSLPIGSRVEITPIDVPERQKIDKKVYKAEISEAENEIEIINSLTTDNRAGLYPRVKTKFDETSSKRSEVKYRITLISGDTEKLEFNENTVISDGIGSDLFDYISFLDAGTYEFKIEPIDEQIEGLVLDKSVWKVKVVVRNISESFARTVSYEKDGEPSDTPPEYEHHYEYPPARFSPKVKKEEEGESPFETNYEFRLSQNRPLSEVVLPEETTLQLKKGETKAFDAITFKAPGSYEFQISETKGNLPGLSYDEKNWDLDVTVENRDEALAVSESRYTREGQENSDGAVFTNTYHSGSLKITKRVVNSTESGPFMFKLNLTYNGEPLEGSYPFTSTISSHSGTTKSGARLAISKDEEITIHSLPVDTSYSLVEEELEPGFVNPGEKSGKITENSISEVVFENRYVPETITYSPAVEKQVTGSPVNVEDFEFQLDSEENYGDAVKIGSTKVEVSGSDKNVFEPITFSKPGMYIFNIRELKKETAGYTFDESVWKLSVNIVDKNAKLEIESVKYENGTNENTTGAVFVNSYQPKSIEFIPKVKKRFVGTPPESFNSYDFILSSLEENGEETIVQRLTLESNTDSDLVFEPITINQAGVYKYLIHEVQSDYPGMETDQSSWHVDVTVADVGGVLVSNEVYYTEEPENSNESLKEKSASENSYKRDYEISQKSLPNRCINFIYKINTLGGSTRNRTLKVLSAFKRPQAGLFTSTYKKSTKNYPSGKRTGGLSILKCGNYKIIRADPGEEKPDKIDNLNNGFSDSENNGEDREYLASLLKTNTAQFTNTYRSGSLEISKVVEGESDKRFSFQVDLRTNDGERLLGDYPYRGSSSGSIKSGDSIELGAGEHIEILELPAGTNFSVHEVEDKDYKTSSTGAEGSIKEDTRSYASFTNTKIDGMTQTPKAGTNSTIQSISLPETGDTSKFIFWIILFGVSVFIIVYLIRDHLKKGKDD